ncbi:MAG: hypothetical protein A2X49_00710 [Lentisphaerae bacterium GWF2_52_8]|nr:MAG: hypothetical protein A2X49_00710 [Lentisphaerae bacterium GWF2_52_8]
MSFINHGFLLLLPVFLFLSGPLSSSAEDFKLEQLLSDKDKFLGINADSFISKETQKYFVWLTEDKKEAHFPGYSNSPALTLFGIKVCEVNVRFKDGKIDDMLVSIYNRGDAGEIDEAKFQALRSEIDSKFSEWAGNKGVEHRKTKVAGCDLNTKVWVKDEAVSSILRWSSTGRGRDFRAEYLNLEFSAFDPKDDPRKTPPPANSLKGAPKAASAKEIKNNVVRKEDGDVYVDNVPMVDQGQKGYCAAATAERILRYYGMDVTQHVLAQIMNTDSDEGTDSEKMLKSLQRASTKYGVRLRNHYDWKFNDFEKLMANYNRFAKKAKKREINLSSYKSLTEIYKDLDLEIMKKAKTESEKQQYKTFLSDIRKHVDEGVPLFWGVVLGIIKEEKIPQVFGGHMRIIIGYNDKTKEIIYTDSWGNGHEFKKMAADDAWVMTNGLYSYDPRR